MADIATNRKAYHDYQVLETYEAGIALRGTEVKSCRQHNVNFMDSHAGITGNTVRLYNLHITPYAQGNINNHEPLRPRSLLLKKPEIRKLAMALKQKGLTLVPLSLYLKHGLIKVKLGVCRGKSQGDKRESLKKKQHERDMRRVMR